MENLLGVLPVLQLPYHEDFTIDRKTLRREIDWVFEQGCNGVVIAMVSEVLRLSDEERSQLTADTVEFVSGRGPVIASVGDESTVQAVSHAVKAEAVGADALMAIPPVTRTCHLTEIVSYYEAILHATGLPLIVQDASGYLGNSIPVEVQADLFHRYPDRILFKPESASFEDNFVKLRKATDNRASIFDGTGGLMLLNSYRQGVIGTMPGTDLCWAISAIWQLLAAGNNQAASQIHALLFSIVTKLQSIDTFLAVEKFLLVEQRIFRNTLIRGPRGYSLDEDTARQFLSQYRLLRRAVDDASFTPHLSL